MELLPQTQVSVFLNTTRKYVHCFKDLRMYLRLSVHCRKQPPCPHIPPWRPHFQTLHALWRSLVKITITDCRVFEVLDELSTHFFSTICKFFPELGNSVLNNKQDTCPCFLEMWVSLRHLVPCRDQPHFPHIHPRRPHFQTLHALWRSSEQTQLPQNRNNCISKYPD